MNLEESRAKRPSAMSPIWPVLRLTASKYIETDGELRAASFAYYAFFALFPLLLLFISLGALIWNQQDAADRVLDFVKEYIPVGPNGQNLVEGTMRGVVTSRGRAGAVALLALCWSSLRFFQALVHGVNRAWGTKEYSWWRLSLANLAMVAIMGSTLLLGVVVPAVMESIKTYWMRSGVMGWGVIEYTFRVAPLLLRSVVLFYGLVMFYKYAPRRKTTFREVWVAALTVTVCLQLVSKGFVIYAVNFGRFNALYGTLGSVVAVLMWIYLSGTIIIFGGCLCAALSEIFEGPGERNTETK